MKLELNIGLWINGERNLNLGPATVGREVIATFKPITMLSAIRFAASGEPTVVIAMTVPHDTKLERNINHLCNLLSQDCIAGKADNVGFLIGPNTKSYGGAFNPEYFIAY